MNRLACVVMVLVTGSSSSPFGAALLAADDCVHFDVPAVVESCDISDEDFIASHPQERLIQLTLPCSTLVDCKDRQRVLQLMFQVRGLSSRYPIVDYLPRTQLIPEIDGPIAVEDHHESSGNLGLDASGSYDSKVKLSGQAKLGKSRGHSERFQKIPDQHLLLASGTINRGSGVYYKFRHSNQTTLEGGHELMLTLRVPATWRGGLMRVDCAARGEEKQLMGADDDFVAGRRSFMVAVYLKGDAQARQTAVQYAQLESHVQQLAGAWATQRSSRHDPLGLVSWLGSGQRLPDDWWQRFMLYDAGRLQTSIRPHLSKPLQRATDRFLVARRDLLRLNR